MPNYIANPADLDLNEREELAAYLGHALKTSTRHLSLDKRRVEV